MVNFLGSSVVKKSKGLAHGTSGWQAADRVKKTGQTLEHFKGILKRTYSGDSTQGSSVALTPFAVPPTTRVKKTGQPYTEHFSTTREGGYQECLGLQKCLKNSKLSLKKDVRFKGVQPVLNMTNCEAVEDQSIQVTPADPPQVRSVRCDKKTRSRVKVIPPIDPSANRAPLERRGCGDITPSNVFSSLKVVAPLDPIQAVVRARSPDYGYCTPPHTYSPTIPSSERYVDIPQNLEPALEVPGVPIAPDSENVIIIIDSPIKDPLGDFPALDPIQDTIRQQSLDCGDYSIPYTCLPTSPNSEQGADIFQNLKQVPLVPDIPTARASEPVIIIIDSPVKEPIVNPPLKEPVVNPPVKEPIIVNSDSHIKLACEEFIYASVICRLNDPPKPLDLSSTGPNGVNKRMCAVNNFQKLDNKPLSPRHTFKHVNTSAARVTVPCYKRGDTAKRLFDVDVLNSEKGKHLPGIQKKVNLGCQKYRLKQKGTKKALIDTRRGVCKAKHLLFKIKSKTNVLAQDYKKQSLKNKARAVPNQLTIPITALRTVLGPGKSTNGIDVMTSPSTIGYGLEDVHTPPKPVDIPQLSVKGTKALRLKWLRSRRQRKMFLKLCKKTVSVSDVSGVSGE
ncbi:uncharacterized protein [Ambystoma mexicanum]|uniref:uncharacterized protein n=1 Tax=Ambystoma mexicanum TaxID=8296 RepID=UPI0037E794F7